MSSSARTDRQTRRARGGATGETQPTTGKKTEHAGLAQHARRGVRTEAHNHRRDWDHSRSMCALCPAAARSGGLDLPPVPRPLRVPHKPFHGVPHTRHGRKEHARSAVCLCLHARCARRITGGIFALSAPYSGGADTLVADQALNTGQATGHIWGRPKRSESSTGG